MSIKSKTLNAIAEARARGAEPNTLFINEFNAKELLKEFGFSYSDLTIKSSSEVLGLKIILTEQYDLSLGFILYKYPIEDEDSEFTEPVKVNEPISDEDCNNCDDCHCEQSAAISDEKPDYCPCKNRSTLTVNMVCFEWIDNKAEERLEAIVIKAAIKAMITIKENEIKAIVDPELETKRS